MASADSLADSLVDGADCAFGFDCELNALRVFPLPLPMFLF